MELELIAWSAIVGTFLPLVISLVKGANMNKGAKQVIALLVVTVASVLTVGADQGWVFASVGEFFNLALASFTAIYALAQTTYTGFWEDRAVEVRLAGVGSNGG